MIILHSYIKDATEMVELILSLCGDTLVLDEDWPVWLVGGLSTQEGVDLMFTFSQVSFIRYDPVAFDFRL